MPSSSEAPEPPRKRQRLVISCTECHRRKQKCDRQQPCHQCVKRGLQNCCSYESSPDSTVVSSVTSERLPSENGDEPVGIPTGLASFPDLNNTADLPSPSIAGSHVTARLGYADDNGGTRTIMDILGGGQHAHATPQSKSSNNVASLYKALVRQLPPKKSIDKLVRFFFAEISWHYDVLDEDTFWEQVSSWERVNYAARSQPLELEPAVRCFPALLFQVLAQAVLLQPRGNDTFLEDIRPAPDMDLVELATEFSDAGHQILSVLGPSESSLVRVHAGLQRAICLKMTGSVVEAWHGIGSAIRDAQELGLHRLHSSSEQEVQQDPQRARHAVSCRRTWLVLHLWDAHMGVVLGRPMITKLDPSTIPLPRGSSGSRGDTVGLAQQVLPFDVILCGYHAAYKHLQDIHNLELCDSGALEKADRIHSSILSGMSQMPAWTRSNSPVHENQASWLPAARETLVTEINFTLLALHRPFIFVQAYNRREALKAALQVLQTQSRLFRARDPRKFLPFDLLFATFDATVIVAAIYILFPGENPEYLQDSLQCVESALEMLRTMKAQNTMAASACTAVQEIFEKFSASISGAYVTHMLPETTNSRSSHHAMEQLLPDQTILADMQSGSTPAATSQFENVVPPLPLHDLIFRDPAAAMPSMYGHDLEAYDTGGASVAANDFWQLLGTFGQ